MTFAQKYVECEYEMALYSDKELINSGVSQAWSKLNKVLGIQKYRELEPDIYEEESSL